MLKDEIKSISSTDADIRSFGYIVGGIIAVLGAMPLYSGRAVGFIGVGIGVLLAVGGVLFPRVIRPVQRMWMRLSLLMGWVMTHVILIILFYGVVTPIALIAHLVQKRFLDMSFRNGRASYWQYRPQESVDKKTYERQF